MAREPLALGSDLRIPRGQLTFVRGEYLWVPDLPRLAPGTHYVKGGSYQVFPPGQGSRFVRIDFKDHEQQMTFLDVDTKTLARPARVKRSWPSNKRFTSITMDLGNAYRVDHAFVPTDGTAVRLAGEGRELIPRVSTLENYYERGSSGKRKVINSIRIRDERPTANIHTLLWRFDRIFAVDTNVYTHRSGQRVWVTSVCRCTLKVVAPDQTLMQYHHETTFLSPELDRDHEISGWIGAIRQLLGPEDAAPERVALVVDSSLGKHDAWNDRAMPLYDALYLPEGWHLLYASSDVGSQEFAPNSMMAACHRASTLAFRDLNKKATLPF